MNRTLLRRWLAALALIALAWPATSQNPTGTLVGRVTDDAGEGLPGVVVTAESPTLQGVRAATTTTNGDYKLAFLPPGTYTVTYTLAGFAETRKELKMSAAQDQTANVTMQLETVSEEIVVTGELETISSTGTTSTTITNEALERLPVARDIEAAVLLTPAASATGPNQNIQIAGAMSFENLWLVNGVVVNENIRGQSLPLFIEDAVQETTTSASGISAEYGRFTGGVVNAITKSGGNEVSGSFRTNFENDDWVSKTPLSGDRIDEVNEIYEATLGGPFWRDHVWFFGAGRDREVTGTDQTRAVTNITFPTSDSEERVEAKLTVTPHPSHTLTGSYLDIDRVQKNTGFGTFLDLDSLNPERKDPQKIKSGNYTGILGASFFAEAQYSERDFTIGIGSGGVPDLIEGTLMRERGTGNRFHAPTFCGSCEDEVRNNENLLLKGNYFLTTDSMGSHDIVFGYDTFDDIRFSINHQTGSDFTVYASDILVDANDNLYPVLTSTAWVRWFAVFNLDIARPTSFKTNSYYVNDSWLLNDKWSLNVGLRYDENDGTNSQGTKVTNDSKVSPRLGVNYDWNADGDMVLHASYGTYVAAIANSRADSTSGGGAIGSLVMFYGGPFINTDASCVDTGTCTTTEEALAILFDWYFANGGITDPNGDLSQLPGLFSVSIPGATAVIPDTLKSPSVDEYVLGVSKRLGTRGLFRADLVYRQWEDFYSNKTTIETGTVETSAGPADLTFVGNFGNSILEREYTGLHVQGQYRFGDRYSLAGSYTLSKLEGNIDGETGPSGPVPESPLNYPEYQESRWAYPTGDLLGDQRHRLRLWGVVELLNTEHHDLSLSVLQNFFSGTPYSAVIGVDTRPYVTNPGYQTPPTSVTYYASDRGAFTTDDVTRTDLSLNYSFLWSAWGKDVEVFLQPEVINLFNEDAVIAVNTDTRDATNDGSLQPFNPFVQTPVEGVNWRKGDEFGKPQSENDYQTPRTFRFSVGFRF